MADPAPPYVAPMAHDAPELLVRFLHNLTRDWVPVGVIEAAMAKARSERYPLQGKHAEWADEKARELVWRNE